MDRIVELYASNTTIKKSFADEFGAKEIKKLWLKMRALADHLKVSYDEVFWDTGIYMDECMIKHGGHYEILTKDKAIEYAQEYAENNDCEEYITDDQIEYWEKVGNGKYYYREL